MLFRSSGGHAVEPEQSTVAIIAHHPQAVYFGMKSGRLPEKEYKGDAIIADPRRRRGHRVIDGTVQFEDSIEHSDPEDEGPEEAAA